VGQGIELDIRPLAYGDLPEVLSIERRSFTAPWSLAMFVLELSRPSGVCLAARSGGELIGYLICSRHQTVRHVMNVAVDLEYRCLGIASALLRRLFDIAGDRDRYALEVRASNTEAVAMYESFGFRISGIRRRYYHDNGEDAVIMWRTWVAPRRRSSP
jgi:ribosomal-protein-alanine N-acetyltransferase